MDLSGLDGAKNSFLAVVGVVVAAILCVLFWLFCPLLLTKMFSPDQPSEERQIEVVETFDVASGQDSRDVFE